MICYFCGKIIESRYYWVPTTRGVYAACCKSCRDEFLKDKEGRV